MDPFYSIKRQDSPLVLHSTALWSYCPFSGSCCISCLVIHRKQCLFPFRPIGQSPLFRSMLATCIPLFRLFICLWFVPLDLCFVYSHKTTQQLFQISLKQRQTPLWSSFTLVLVVSSEETPHPSRWHLSHTRSFMQVMIHTVLWGAYCFSYLAHLQSAVCQFDIVYFVTLSTLVAFLRAPEHDSSKTDVQPRRNSVNYFCRSSSKEKSHGTLHPSAF